MQESGPKCFFFFCVCVKIMFVHYLSATLFLFGTAETTKQVIFLTCINTLNPPAALVSKLPMNKVLQLEPCGSYVLEGSKRIKMSVNDIN